MKGPTTLMDVALASRQNGHAGADQCRCPLCLTVLPPDKYAAIIGSQKAHDDEVRRKAEEQFASKEAVIRREMAAKAAADAAAKIERVEKARKAAERAVKVAKATFEATLKERLETEAEAAAKARVEAVNAVTGKFFGENLRLQERVLELQRMLEKKTANELGDAGEADTYSLLVAEFGGEGADELTRTAKGANGADIEHRVFSHGECVGSLLVEVKNVRRWSNAWVPKLRQDMIHYGAGHGVIVTATFPADEHQLAIRDGIVITSPARAIAVIHILRRAIIQFHTLKLSNADRDEKTARLYELLISDRAGERWRRISSATTDLVEIETADAAHQLRTRDKRLTKVRTIIAVHDEFVGDIDAILRGEAGDVL